MKFRLIFSGIIALGALILDWLLLADSSPFHNYFVWHPELPNLWAVLHIFPIIGSAIVAGNPHSGSEIIYSILLVTQWFVIGFFLSRLARYLAKK